MAIVNYEHISVGTAAVGLTTANLTRANRANPSWVRLTISDSPIQYHTDGTTATAGPGGGTRLEAGAVRVIASMSELQNLSMIRTTDAATNAAVDVQYGV